MTVKPKHLLGYRILWVWIGYVCVACQAPPPTTVAPMTIQGLHQPLHWQADSSAVLAVSSNFSDYFWVRLGNPPVTTTATVLANNLCPPAPDGQKALVFEQQTIDFESGNIADVYLVQLDGAKQLLWVQKAMQRCAVWAADGQSIAFVARSKQGDYLAIQGLQEADPKIVYSTTGQLGAFAWSPDGTKVAVAEHPVLHIISVVSNTVITLAPAVGGPDTAIGKELTGPAWSPDSQYLAYIEQRYPDIGGGGNIVISKPEIDARYYLTQYDSVVPPNPSLFETRFKYSNLLWSPDGKYLAASEFPFLENGFIHDGYAYRAYRLALWPVPEKFYLPTSTP